MSEENCAVEIMQKRVESESESAWVMFGMCVFYNKGKKDIFRCMF